MVWGREVGVPVGLGLHTWLGISSGEGKARWRRRPQPRDQVVFGTRTMGGAGCRSRRQSDCHHRGHPGQTGGNAWAAPHPAPKRKDKPVN